MNFNSNTNLIEIFEDEPRISHRIIAKEIFEFDPKKRKSEELQLKSKTTQVKELIIDNIKDFEEFGRVRIETESDFSLKEKQQNNPNYRAEITYFLNEPQATLLLTFMRNNEIVKKFKIKLVKEFFKMREILNSQNSQQNKPVQTSEKFDLDSYISENEKLIKLIKIITSEDSLTLHYLDKLTKTLNLKSPVDLLQIDLNSYYFIPTELGKFFNKSAVEINKILEAKGFQIKINGVWQLTENGKNYAIQLDNKFSTIKWKLETLI